MISDTTQYFPGVNGPWGQQYPGIGPGGCFPQPQPWPPYNRGQYHGNLPDAQVGNRPWGGWFGQEPVRGFGLDLDNDGRYTRGQDGVLAFDFNRDGRLNQNEIERSNQMLKAMGGNYDANGDGNVSFWERIQGEHLRKQGQSYDRNRDGRLDTNELSQAGGKVWIDRDRDGRADRSETHSPYSFPGRWGGSQRLDFVDPWGGYNRTSDNWSWYQPPWGGGGCGCHHGHDRVQPY